MAGMPMPDWYYGAKENIGKALSEPIPPMNPPPEMEKVTDLPNLFAEYELKGQDVLLHLFPREGLDDQWVDGHYLNRCHNCHSEVPIPSRPTAVTPCPCCGHTGLIYVPGRAEGAQPIKFSDNARELIKESIDSIWMGDVAIELVPEIGAYVVQIQKAKGTAVVVGLADFVRQACIMLSELLSSKN